MMQTIALASTQVFQPIWSRTIAQPESSSHHQKTDAIDGTALPSASSASLATVAAPAQTPQKGHLLRAASPLLEEMLDSPVTTSKPTQEAAAGSPERHALYQDMLHSSSSHQQGLLPRLSCGISPNDRNAAGCRPGLSAVGDAANTDRRRQGPFQFPDKQAESSGSMSSSAIGGPAVTTAIGADASLDGSRCGHNAQANAAAVTNSASHHIGAVAEDPACCCSDTNACASTARISSECSPTHPQAMTGGKLAVKSNGRYQGAGVELTAHQDIAQQHPGKPMLSHHAF